ncbi:MAG: glycosyltransferase [Pseudomonadota bacterium]
MTYPTSSASSSIARLAVVGAFSEHDFYQRNRVLVSLLSEMSSHTAYVGRRTNRVSHAFSSWDSRWTRLANLFHDAVEVWRGRERIKSAVVVFVPYPSYLTLLWLHFFRQRRGRVVLADAFLELRSTVVEDRRLLRPGSLADGLLGFFQRYALNRSSHILIDTDVQKARLEAELGPSHPPVTSIPVGIDETLWKEQPQPAPDAQVNVVFWGTLIPLHGVEFILDAAELLEAEDVGGADRVAIQFRLIGDGQGSPDLAARLKRRPVSSLSWHRALMQTEQLRAEVAKAHIVLGVFGESPKAGSVIPYKLTQALASNRPVISRDSAAIDHLRDDERGLFTCAPADGAALAQAIAALAARLRSGWMPKTRSIYDEHLSNARVKSRLAAALDL